MPPTYIADKSALARMTVPSVAERLAPLITRGDVATCGVIELEVLFSARSEREIFDTHVRRGLAYPRIAMSEADFTRAEEVMIALAKRGHHRAVSLPDLLVSAVAERSKLIVLHYDADYDIVADATGQPMEWVVQKGSL